MPAKDKARARASQSRYKKNIVRLQRAGLLDKVNLRLKRDPKAQRAIIKYRQYLLGHVAAVKTDHAKDVAKKFGYAKRGNTVMIPRAKHERISVNKSGEIVSKYPNPLDKNKTITRKTGAKLRAPKAGEKVYYTIRERRRGLGTLKRTTFAKFDDLLEYLAAYDIDWDNVEPFFETEIVSGGDAKQYDETIAKERRAGHKRWERRRRRKLNTKSKHRKSKRKGGGK